MKRDFENTDCTPQASLESVTNTSGDYSTVLHQFGLSYKYANFHYKVNESSVTQGWILHISVVLPQLTDLLTRVLPKLIAAQTPFKIARNKEIAQAILGGQMGLTELGKLIAIYPPNEEEALKLARNLIEETKGFKGPRILTDFQLGTVVYTRYGAYNPLVLPELDGSFGNYFYNTTGNLVKDIETIPCVLVKGLSWPFESIASPEAPGPTTLLNGKYKITAVLKTDAKGNVSKGFFMQKFLRWKWCVVKEGKQNMMFDQYGRDIRDRLLWQYNLQNDLRDEIPIPKPYELFEEHGNSYLVMEYIKGQTLDNIIVLLYKNTVWWKLDHEHQLQLIDYAFQIVNCIERMHNKEYIHRDINTVNFLATKQNRLVMIDLELVSSIKQGTTVPPFTYGTSGFMSPQQEAVETPTVADDVYSLGATLLAILTGLLPGKFELREPDLINKQLAIFIPDQDIVKIISGCLSKDPFLRPSLAEVKPALQQFRHRHELSRKSLEPSGRYQPDVHEVESVVKKALQGLASPIMKGPDELWFSKTIQPDSVAYSQTEQMTISGGFHSGLSGIMYLLAEAKKYGFDIKPCMLGYTKSLAYLKQQYLEKIEDTPGGLYNGLAGITLALTSGIESGLIGSGPEAIRGVELLLQSERLQGLSIADGLAGQGMALLKSVNLVNSNYLTSRLNSIVTEIVNSQQNDGSWLVQGKNSKQQQNIGFGNGITGIITFLLSYLEAYEDFKAKKASKKALEWLIKKTAKIKRRSRWMSHRKGIDTDLGINNGLAGIALTFIKAYKIFNDPLYQQAAAESLNNYPFYISTRNLTLSTGLVGIGEAYLEAAQTFNNDEWKKRAEWITYILLHQYKQPTESTIYWMTDDSPITTADFMVGNSGIIYFLLRYLNPGILGHPLLPTL